MSTNDQVAAADVETIARAGHVQYTNLWRLRADGFDEAEIRAFIPDVPGAARLVQLS